MKTTPATIADIQSLVRMQLGKKKVAPQDLFFEDLGAESADIVNIIATLEERYGVSFDETDIARLRSVQDLYEFITHS